MVFVVVSLIAVFLQLKQNTETIRIGSTQKDVEMLVQSWADIASNGELAGIVING